MSLGDIACVVFIFGRGLCLEPQLSWMYCLNYLFFLVSLSRPRPASRGTVLHHSAGWPAVPTDRWISMSINTVNSCVEWNVWTEVNKGSEGLLILVLTDWR